MRGMYYKLDDDNSVVETDSLDWLFSIGNQPDPNRERMFRRKVAQSELDGEWEVSTVFLGINHAFNDGPPMLFETMIFGDKYGNWCDRYSTWDEAKAGHECVVAMLLDGTFEVGYERE